MSFPCRNFLFVAAMLALSAAAGASTVTYNSDLSAGQNVTEAAVLMPGDEILFSYNVMDDLNIASFALSASGNSAGADIGNITFGFTSPGDTHYTTIVSIGSSTFGGGFLPGVQLSAGDTLSIYFTDGIAHPVSVTLSFLTTAPAPVPLPASGVLLAVALLGMGVYASRKLKPQAEALTA